MYQLDQKLGMAAKEHSSVIQMKVESPKKHVVRNVETSMVYGAVVTLFAKVCKGVGA